MSDQEVYIPLSEYLSTELWPADLFQSEDGTFLDRIAYDGGTIGSEDDTITADIALRLMDEITFQLPAGFAFVLGLGPVEAWLEADPDGFQATIYTDVLKLRLPRSLFVPVIDQDGQLVPDPDPTHFVDISLPLDVTVDQDLNVDLDWPGETPGQLDLPPCMIGESGVIISAEDIMVRLSSNQPLPDEAEAAGLDPDWNGIFIREAAIHLPEGLGSVVPSDLTFNNCFIGEGGFSGEVAADWDPALSGTLFGVTFSLKHFSLTFVQNSLTASEINGTITLPFFDEPVDVEIGINLDGSFAVKLTNTGPEGLYTLRKEGLLELKLDSLAFEVTAGEFKARLAGSIQPLVDIGGAAWPSFKVKEMVIYADGRVELDGGWLNLPEQHRLDFHGFTAELTQMGFGETDDGYRWMGFSGQIQLVADLGLGAQFDRLRLLWRASDGGDIHFALDGVGVDLTIPDVLAFKGVVRFVEDGGQRGFKGGVKLTLPSLKMAMDADILIIQAGGFTAFYVYVNSNFPSGVPLASTGIALYGLAGLLGQNVAPDKREQEQWYENWYKGQRLAGGGTSKGVAASDKWVPNQGRMAFGAGVTLGTATDNGYAINGKLLMVLLLPGPIILLEGRAGLLRERSDLAADTTSEPPFEALAVLDQEAGQFLLNIAARYKKDSAGRIIDVRGGAEAFFDFHRADAWHLYLGQDEPREKRIRAEVLSLFQADTYLMLSARDLRIGFWVGYDDQWKFGPLRVILSAWIAADAVVSWKPTHFHGQLQLHGAFELKAFGAGTSIQVDARIAADTPTPYHIEAEFRVKLNLPWPLPDPKATVKLNWGDEDRRPPLALPLGAAAVEHLKVSEKWPLDQLPHYDTDGDGFWNEGASESVDETAALARPYDEDDADSDGFLGTPLVPLDARPVLSFAKPVFDDIGFGHRREGVAEAVGDTRFEYRLVRLELHKKPRSGGAWELVARRSENPAAEVAPEKLTGTWQLVNSGNDALPNAKLALWSKTPADWGREQTGLSHWDWVHDHLPETDCPPPPPITQTCVTWDEVPTGKRYQETFIRDDLIFKLTPPGLAATVVYRPRALFGRLRALQLLGATAAVQLIITGFPYSTTKVTLYLDVPRGSQDTRVEAFYEGTRVAGPVVPAGLGTVTLEAAAIDTVIIETLSAHLYGVCYEAPLNPDRQEVADGWANSVNETAKGWLQDDTVLATGTYYRLTVVTDVHRDSALAKRFTEKVYFQTDQPPGVYDLPGDSGATTVNNQHEHFPTQGPLRDLSPYVQHTVPAPEARAVYRAYDIGAYFNENYVRAMYAAAGKPLKVFPYDAKGNLVTNLTNLWDENPTLTLTRPEAAWLLSLDQAPCVDGPDLADVPPDDHLNGYAPGLLLRPETLYEARLVADGGAAEQYAVYKWRFITSRFAHFRHHIGSFRDRVWDEHVLRGRPETPLLTAEQLVRVETLVTAERDGTPLPAGDPPRFEEIAHLFGFGTQPQSNQPGRWLRPAPDHVEVTLLRDGTRRYGLLLESPDPLDAQRVTIEAQYSDTLTPLPDPAGAVRVLDARLAPAGAALNDEYVDILLLQNQDLSGWRIEHTGSAAPVDTTFTAYYTFPPDSAFQEGTLIRVHSGHAADDPTPAVTYQHRYVEADVFQLNASGDWLRLVDAQGRTAYSRFYLPSLPDSYTPQAMVVIWNADRTAAFLFFPDGATAVGATPDGQYRLVCTFKRTVAGQPTLKQENQTADEAINLDLTLGVGTLYREFGDVNMDGVVDVHDIQAIASRWRRPAEGEDATYDINDDGTINIIDIQQAARNWGRRFD